MKVPARDFATENAITYIETRLNAGDKPWIDLHGQMLVQATGLVGDELAIIREDTKTTISIAGRRMKLQDEAWAAPVRIDHQPDIAVKDLPALRIPSADDPD